MKRSSERLEEIDTFLREHYKEDGGRFCADSLGERLSYISSRVQHKGISGKQKKVESKSQIDILSGKVTAKNNEIKELWNLLEKQREINSKLRTENIRLINEKVHWKMAKNES